MSAVAKVAPYDVARAFMGAWRSAIARHQLAVGGLVGAHTDGELLIVGVKLLPEGSFNPAFLDHGPGHARDLFSPAGEHYWRQLHAIGMAAAQGPDARSLVAIVLLGEAVEAARDSSQRAAA